MSENYEESSLPLLETNSEGKTTMAFSSNTKRSSELPNVFIEPVFEKKAFKFDSKNNLEKISFDKYSKDFEIINARLENISSELLHHWTNVKVVLPDSIVDEGTSFSGKDLFILPSIDELEQISIDPVTGNRKSLNKFQLESIKKTASFDVASENFPDKKHTWKLARWLQKGSEKANESFLYDMSQAVGLLIITARNRFISKRFSLLSGIKSWVRSAFNLLDILIGMPRTDEYRFFSEIDQKIKDGLQIFLVSDLKVDETEIEIYKDVCAKIISLKDDSQMKKELERLPLLYRTPQNLLIDLRLLDAQLVSKIKPILEDLLKNTPERRLILKNLRDKLIKQYQDQGLADSEIHKNVTKKLIEEYREILFSSISESSKLENISTGIAKLLCDSARSLVIMQDEETSSQEELNEHMSVFEAMLKKKHNVKTLIYAWLQERMDAENKRFMEANAFTVNVRTLEKLKQANLYQTAYFVERELVFFKEKRNSLVKNELQNKKSYPSQTFEFKRMIWQPKNYTITKNPSSGYSLKKTTTYTSNTFYPFWRWKNFFLRTWVYLTNSLFIFGVLIPFMSPFSFQALFSIKPFYPGYVVDNNTGKLVKDLSESNKKLTFISRVSAIWEHVRFSRRRFENQPDTGLLGKHVTRFFNCTWNYFFKGVLGTLSMVLVYPLLCVFVSTSSIFIGLTTPVWYPILSALQHLLFVLIFDWELDTKIYTRFFPIFTILLKFFVCGIISPILALFTGIFVCPIGSFIVVIFGIIRRFNRKILDSLMFNLILKRLARVPASDSFVAKRISGPGLASNYLYQIRAEQALAAVEIKIEIEILDSFIEYIGKRLRAPLETYQKLFDPIFGNYSYELAKHSPGPYKDLSSEIELQYKKYDEIYQHRLNKLKKQINSQDLSKARLSQSNLEIVLHETTKIVQFYYESSILKYRGQSSDEMFKQLELEDNDWKQIAGKVLEEIFGTGILVPVEESDDYFNLEIKHLNLEKYAEMIANSKLNDDLDDLNTRYFPKSESLDIKIPENNMGMFLVFSSPGTQYDKSSNYVVNFHLPPCIPSKLAFFVLYNANDKDIKETDFKRVLSLRISNGSLNNLESHYC